MIKKEEFINIKDYDLNTFIKKLSLYKNVTLHQIFLKGEYYGGWNDDLLKRLMCKCTVLYSHAFMKGTLL